MPSLPEWTSRRVATLCAVGQVPSASNSVEGVVADFGRFSLPRRTSRLAATRVHVNQSSWPISWHLLHTGFALRQYGNPCRQKGPTLTINSDYAPRLACMSGSHAPPATIHDAIFRPGRFVSDDLMPCCRTRTGLNRRMPRGGSFKVSATMGLFLSEKMGLCAK